MKLLLPTLLLCAAVVPAFAATLSPAQLRCEYLENPLGLDELHPRLSWIVTSAQRAAKQTGYQILAASSEAALRADRGDLWDSGKVASDATAQIAYAGAALASGQRGWWKVRVWDSAFLIVPWRLYEYYGDTTALKRHYESHKRYVDYLTSRAKDGIVAIGLGDVNAWMMKNLAGINPDPAAPGFKHILIRPNPVGDLTAAKAHYDSIRGRIASEWTLKDGVFRLGVMIPANSTATVALPATDAAKISEGGQPLSAAKGVTFTKIESGRALVEIGSGDYSFAVAR